MTANILRKNTFLSNEPILFALSFIVLFFCSQCSPLYLFNDWGDPNIYFSIGKGMFNGKVIYKDLFDHKGPLIFLIYGLGYLISHTTFWGVYIFESLFLFVNLLFAYKIAKLFLDKDKSLLVSLLYLFFFLCRTKQGGSADELITPCLMVSLYYTLRYCTNRQKSESRLNRHFAIHGVMFGIVFFVKLSICTFWPPLLAIPVLYLLKEHKYKKLLSASLFFVYGFLLVAIPVVAYFVCNSAFNDFKFAYFEFNSLYASASMGLHFDAFANIVARFLLRLISPDFYVYMLLLSMAFLLFSKKYICDILPKVCILLSFVLVYIIVTSGPFDMDYYYITLSVFSIIGFIHIIGLADSKMEKYKWLKPTALTVVLFACIAFKGFFGQKAACLLRTEECSFWQKDFAAIINTAPDAILIDLEHETGVNTIAGIVPAYKYFFHPNIHDDAFPQLKEYHINLVKDGKPDFVITNNKEFPYINENYHIAARHRQYEGEEHFIYLFRRNGL
ncbi:glycosyltransferase family 39 protein [Dysgonomonas sp. 511]|uniref:glycosyltransferase family 39 protein n=1 Tax=Dysgonomonas sp. 511 TaxID=2302930 RepID=UPI0013D871B8|nr:glycosyltransferase family 39 protein [Dysgonomonas sp. 511]